MFSARAFDNTDSASGTSLRPQHFLKLVQQPEVHVPAAAALPDFPAERLQTRVAPRVAARCALELFGALAAQLDEPDVAAAEPRSAHQTAAARRQHSEQHFVESRPAVCAARALHEVEHFFERQPVLDVLRCVDAVVVAALTADVDALDGLDDGRVRSLVLFAERVVDRPAELAGSDELVLGFGLNPVDDAVCADFEAAAKRGIVRTLVCVSDWTQI